jgi:Ca2+-binding RTX toxin-like protein
VKVHAGSSASGTPVQTLNATRSGGSWSVDGSPALADGTYTARAEQSDAAGNTGQSGAHTFTIDSTPPNVGLTTPANGSSTSDTTPAYSGGAGDAASDSSTVTVKVYAGSSASGTPVQTLSATRSGASWTIDGSPGLSPGTYTARAEQSDAAGNTASSNANTFTITPTTPPPLTCDGRPATISGNGANNVIKGTKGPDVIVAGAGNDRIKGRGGDDLICAGAGRDKVRAGGGEDVVFGGDGRDKLSGNKGADRIHGEADNDRLRGGAGNDRLFGEDGDDALFGGSGGDFMDGGPDRDRCAGGPGADTEVRCER